MKKLILKLLSKIAKHYNCLFSKTPSIEKEKNKFKKEREEVEYPQDFGSLLYKTMKKRKEFLK